LSNFYSVIKFTNVALGLVTQPVGPRFGHLVYLKHNRSKLVKWLSELHSEHRSGPCSTIQAARMWCVIYTI